MLAIIPLLFVFAIPVVAIALLVARWSRSRVALALAGLATAFVCLTLVVINFG
jgi:hypothetical protein